MQKGKITVYLSLTLLIVSSLSLSGNALFFSTNGKIMNTAGYDETLVLIRIQTDDFEIELPNNAEIVGMKSGEWLDVIIPKTALSEIDDLGVTYEITITDVKEYDDQVRADYHTFPETESFLQNIASNYTSITSLYSIGTTYEGRNIWCIEISDNPGVDESEPGVFFMGLHHAREWPSLEICLYIVDNLTSNYGSDADITNMVNNRRIWIVPCVNPDGYVYDHDQGHDWRKNRRYFPQWGTYGVDLNRNYGGTSNGNIWGSWGSIGDGSVSNNPSNSLFNGPMAFSENESKAIREMFLNDDICSTITWHTHGELVLWPWGYDISQHTPDDTYMSSVGIEIASRITGQYGSGTYTPEQSAGLYPTTGDTTDWAYGYSYYELGRSTFAYTIEACTSFHPSSSVLAQVTAENYDGAFYLLEEAQNISNIVPQVLPPLINDMPPDNDGTYTVSWNQQNPTASPDYYQLDELTDLTLQTEDAENGSSLWNLDGFQLSTARSNSGSYSFKSRTTNYDVSAMTSAHPIPVAEDMNLSFWTWYEIENNYDKAFVEVSRDGRFYEILENYTDDSNGWIYQEFPLDDYVGESIYIRFRYTTDAGTLDEGFYVDDIHPVADFATINTLSSTIANEYYQITGNPDGIYYYRVKGHNTDRGWGDFSTLKGIQVGSNFGYITSLLEGWNFISAPFLYNIDKTDLMINYNNEYYSWVNATSNNNPTSNPIINPNIFGWDRTNQLYNFASYIDAGYGYWLYSYNNCELYAPTYNISSFDDLITNLKQKWNIVGMPFNQIINKTDLMINYNNVDYSWADAVSAGIVTNVIFGWDRTAQSYVLSDTLQPGNAYWIYANYDCSLLK